MRPVMVPALVEPYPVPPYGLAFHARLPGTGRLHAAWISGRADTLGAVIAEVGAWLADRGHAGQTFSVDAVVLDTVISWPTA